MQAFSFGSDWGLLLWRGCERELARQFTLSDSEELRSCDIWDFMVGADARNANKAGVVCSVSPNVERLLLSHLGVAQWLAEQVIHPARPARTLTCAVVLYKCQKLCTVGFERGGGGFEGEGNRGDNNAGFGVHEQRAAERVAAACVHVRAAVGAGLSARTVLENGKSLAMFVQRRLALERKN